jgi:hypothetical protein
LLSKGLIRDDFGEIDDHPINRIADLLPWNVSIPSPYEQS